MGSKIYAPQTSGTATDWGRVFNINFGAISNTKVGTTVGVSSAGGAGATGGGAGSGAPFVQGADQTGGYDFSNMISGIDEKELDLFKTILGANYNLSMNMAGVTAQTSQEYSKAVTDLQVVKTATSDLQESVSKNMKWILIGGGIILIALIFRKK